MINAAAIAADAVDMLATETLSVERRTGSYDGTGRWVDAAPTSISVTAQVTPARGRDLRRLPEGRRSEEALRIITRTELLVPVPATSQKADVVTRGGRQYEVEHVENWGAFYDAIAVRMGD